MVFSSAVFLFLFLPAVFLLYRVIPGLRAKNVLLLVCSLVFYAYGEPVYVLLLLASVLINYLCGRLIASGKHTRPVLAAAVVLNLGLLFVFKYTDFFLGTVNGIFSASLPLAGLALPIGVSFYTFQGLSYVIDVYRDRSAVSRSFVKLALYISFFPQLIAGPIVKYHDVSEQIDRRETSLALTADGARRFILGLSKKLLLANAAGGIADAVYASSVLDIRSAWLGAVCYLLQIYFDFSGYSDMAIGMGRMFGFRFLENFRYPYASASVKEFWRRWHISLSTWFRDYLYIPLGGSRTGKLRTVRNKLIVFLCTGLWHGASWNFVLWGLWHGAFLTLEDLTSHGKKERSRNPLRFLGTLLVVLLGFVLFRAETLPEAGRMFSQMFAGFTVTPQSDAFLQKLLTPLNLCSLLAGCVCAMPLLPRLREAVRGRRIEPVLEVLSYALSLGLLLLCVLNLAGSEFNPFIYYRF